MEDSLDADFDKEWLSIVEEMLLLHRSAWKGDTKGILHALRAGADVDAPNSTGYSALIGAVAAGHEETVRLLLLHGANPHITGPSGGTPLMSAAAFCHHKIACLLLQQGADPNARADSGDTALLRVGGPLHAVSDAERKESIRATFQVLLEAGADSNAANQRGQTPLMDVALYPDLMAILLQHGANINAQNANGDTALMQAVRNDLGATVAFLLENGADVSITNTIGVDALQIAQGKADGFFARVGFVSEELVALLRNAG